MILGIALGVAVVVAIDLANAGARRAFDLSAEAVAGRATHVLLGGPQGLDETLYARLKRQGLGAPLAPVLSQYVASPQLGGQPMQLLGVDPFAEPPFRSYLSSGGVLGGDPQQVAGRQALDLTAFITQPGAVLIAQSLADRYALRAGQVISIETGGKMQPAFIAGLVQPSDELARRGLEGIILADIATAQELTGRVGYLDRIDVILVCPTGGECPQAERLKAALPPGLQLQDAAARSGAVAQMTSAFRVNLTALSLLALLVGMFLIYNTMTFSVVQRRRLFGMLRCIGVTRRQVFSLVMGEALAVGVVGSLLGLALGVLLGQGAVRLVTQTMNDLFFVVSVRGIQISLSSLVKGGLIGLLSTLATAAPPAWEAASVPPRAALLRSGLESKARLAMGWAALGGLGLLALGGALLWLPPAMPVLWGLPLNDLALSFAGTFLVVVGAALQTPVIVGWLMRRLTEPLGRLGGTLGRMAPRNVTASLSRTAIAVMALMVAVSVTIGVSVMVGSFRRTVVTWLGETLQGDIYVSAPSLTSVTPSAPLSLDALAILRAQPGVERVDVLRAAQVESPDGPVNVDATDSLRVGQERVFLALDGSKDTVLSRLQAGSVLVSEPYANRVGLPLRGGQVTLNTPTGPQVFPVIGVYYDYASTQGTVLMDLGVYQRLWNDPMITAAGLRLAEGQDVDAVVAALQNRLSGIQRLVVRANRALRQEVLAVFDRTFAITGALQILATIVAFMGILSALLSLELERRSELGVLRAVGMTARQLWRLILLETGLMGLAAGLLAMPTGYLLSLILIYIINRRSFGWTLQMQLSPEPFIQALLVALGAALLAGIYPAWRMGRNTAVEALRSE